MYKKAVVLLALSVAAMAILGYHPGLEDDAYYLAAIRSRLDPALFPHDGDFFRLQFQATLFDRLIAASVRLTHLPLEWTTLLWQFAAVATAVGACRRIAEYCFEEEPARWAAVGMVAALFTIPVSGTGISIMDQYLHPRNMATALLLWAVAYTLGRRYMWAAVLLAAAASLHVIMAAFGVSCCLFLAYRNDAPFAALLLPLGWIFDPASPAWKKAAATRSFYFLGNWEWYEWLGVLAPLAILWCFGRRGRRLACFAAFHLILALIVMLPPGLERLRPFEPMRYLQLVYIFMFLLMGGMIGKHILKQRAWRWIVFFAPLCAGMTYAQLDMYPATAHLEWPGTAGNQWVRAFAWIGANTLTQSYFALNPEYMALPGEDYHGFRALAGRGAMADNLKDPGMAARVPRLADRWLRESEALRGWKNFGAVDFQSLKAEFGIDWVVVENPAVTGLDCPYRDGALRVCRVG